MVVTRRISTNPKEDEASNVQPQASPAPAPMSREMRRLFIDANPLLGGQAPSEPNISKKRKSVAFADLVQDDTGDQEEALHTRENGAQQRDGYWFLPEGAASTETSASSPSSEHLTQRSDGTISFAARDERSGASDAPISVSSQSPDGLESAAHGKTLTVGTPGDSSKENTLESFRSSKLSREIKRLLIDANPSLSFVDFAWAEPTSSTIKGKRPAHNSREVPDSQESRAGNSSLDRTPHDVPFDEFVRLRGEQAAKTRFSSQRLSEGRVSSSSSKSAPKRPRRPRKNPHPQHISQHAKVFPDPCPEELADQILRIFGEAAGDAVLLRALEGTAQDSIAREVRHETSGEYSERAKMEIEMLETWGSADKSLTWDEHKQAVMARYFPPSKAEIKAMQQRRRAERAERRSSKKDPVVVASGSTNAQQRSTSDVALDGKEAEGGRPKSIDNATERESFMDWLRKDEEWQNLMAQLSPGRQEYFDWYMSLEMMTEEEHANFKEQNAEADRVAEEQRRVEIEMAGDPEWEREQEEKRRREQEELAAFEALWQDELQEKIQRMEEKQKEQQRREEQQKEQQRQEEQPEDEQWQEELSQDQLLQEELLREDRRRDKGKGRAI
ncbi:hypothetical protein MBLNU457_5164t1 [Dothideomycetes sp. NU457]